MSVDALAMFSSLIQNAQSTAGTLISAFGNNRPPSAFLMPLVWSGCRWEMTTISIIFGSMPAAAMFALSKPIGGFAVGPQPVSINTSFEPVLITCGLNGIVTMPLGM